MHLKEFSLEKLMTSFNLQIYLQLVTYPFLTLIPSLLKFHGVHHLLYLVQVLLNITYLLLTMEQLLTLTHQADILFYSLVI